MSFRSQVSGYEEQQYWLPPPPPFAASSAADQGNNNIATIEDGHQEPRGGGKAMLICPENSCTADYAADHHFNTTNKMISSTKPTGRRRSRASKRSPMVLLNTSATNFRALVQQYTGCHSSPSSSYKGTVNLSFGGNNSSNIEETNDHQTAMKISAAKFGYSSSSKGQDHDDHKLQQPLIEDDDDDQEAFVLGAAGSHGTHPDASLLFTNSNAYATSSDFDYGFANDLPPGDDHHRYF